MKVQKAFRYELMPDGVTRRAFTRFAGAKRFVWNRALSQENYLGYNANSKLLTIWKTELPWLREPNAQVLQQALKDLDRAFKNFFSKRASYPKLKKKFKSGDSFRFPQGFRLEEANNRVFLPKIGWVRYRNSRALRGVAKNVTVSRRGGKWFISVQTEMEVAEPVHPSTSIVGVDLGVVRFATLSDGSHVDPLNALRKSEYRLRRYQRQMARKQKFSKNWKKAKTKVQKLYRKIGDSRRDFLHKSSTKISKNHAIVCIEDLKVKNMSAGGAHKRGLNKSILDQGWSEFRRMLEYKQAWKGGIVIAVPAMYTSQTCPECGHVSGDNRKTQAEFVCVLCGYSANADFVGARNILAAGHAVLACGGDVEVRRPVKQELTEVAA